MLRYKEIKNELLKIIAEKSSGEKLPSRPELCIRLETTRTTLDRAIRELVEEEVLCSRKGSGTCVVGEIEKASPNIENWCVIVPNVMDDIYPGLIRGIENIAQNRDTNIILCNSDNNTDKQEQYIRRLMLSKVSGFIIVPTISSNMTENIRLYGSLRKAKIPFVFCNRSVEGISAPVVTSNDYYGGYIATKYLLSRGYRNIAYIAKLKYRTSMDRCQGYITALMESGIEINHRLILVPEQDDTFSPYLAVKELLASDMKMDAVFCFNDYIAFEVYRAIQDSGLLISDQIGIIGYDNISGSSSCTPSLTSVSYKNVEMGEKAGELLYGMSHNVKTESNFDYHLFQPSIVERSSCKGKK